MPLNFVNKILDFELNLDIHREEALKAVFKNFEDSFKDYLSQHKTQLPNIYLVAFVDGKQITKYYDGTDLYYPSSPLLLFGSASKKQTLKKISCIRAFSHLTSLQGLTVTSAFNDWFESDEGEKLIKNIGFVHVNGKKVKFQKDNKLKWEYSIKQKETKKEFNKLVQSISNQVTEEHLDGSIEFKFDPEQTKKVISSIGIEVKDQETAFKFLASLLHAYASSSGFNHIYYLPSVKMKENGQVESLGFIVVSSNTQLDELTTLLKVSGGVLLGNIGLIESNFQTKKAIHKPHIRKADYNPEYLFQVALKIKSGELDKEIIVRYFEKNIVKAMSRLKRYFDSGLSTKKAVQFMELENYFETLKDKIDIEVEKNSNMKDELLDITKILESKPKANDSTPLGHPNQFITEEDDWLYYEPFNYFGDYHIKNLDEDFFKEFVHPILMAFRGKSKSKLASTISEFQNQTSRQLINGQDSFISFRNRNDSIALFTKKDWELINQIILENYCMRAGGSAENYNSIISINASSQQIVYKMQHEPISPESKVGVLISLNGDFREFKLSHLKYLICAKYNSRLTLLNVSENIEALSLKELTDKAKWELTTGYNNYEKGFYYILEF